MEEVMIGELIGLGMVGVAVALESSDSDYGLCHAKVRYYRKSRGTAMGRREPIGSPIGMESKVVTIKDFHFETGALLKQMPGRVRDNGAGYAMVMIDCSGGKFGNRRFRLDCTPSGCRWWQ